MWKLTLDYGNNSNVYLIAIYGSKGSNRLLCASCFFWFFWNFFQKCLNFKILFFFLVFLKGKNELKKSDGIFWGIYIIC